MNSIQTYHTGFTICLIITIIAFVLAGIMFFAFNIREIYAIRTGRAHSKEIERAREKNLKTDQLGRRRNFFSSGSLKGKTGQTKGTTGPTNEKAKTDHEGTSWDTAALSKPDEGMTSVLSAVPEAGVQVAQAPIGFRFVITENTMVIHTEEIII